MSAKPWMKQPGELHDKHGVPIYPGDLIRSFHFRGGPRRRIYYLYHTAAYVDGAMRMVPTMFLEPTKRNRGGECLMSQGLMDEAEVIMGSGPGDCLDCFDRPRVKKE
jgi:hypothetical protein